MKMHVIIVALLCVAANAEQMKYYSQVGQDQFLNENFFNGMKEGIFIEFGAHDGISFSNTYFFEKNLRWHGICIEPIPSAFEQLKRNRTSICLQGCVSNFNGPAKFLEIVTDNSHLQMLSGLIEKYDPRSVARIQLAIAKHGGTSRVIDVMCYTFDQLVQTYNLSHINYLSIDTEGGELDILKSIDFNKIIIDYISVEDNYRDSGISKWLEAHGYRIVKRLKMDIICQRIKN